MGESGGAWGFRANPGDNSGDWEIPLDLDFRRVAMSHSRQRQRRLQKSAKPSGKRWQHRSPGRHEPAEQAYGRWNRKEVSGSDGSFVRSAGAPRPSGRQRTVATAREGPRISPSWRTAPCVPFGAGADGHRTTPSRNPSGERRRAETDPTRKGPRTGGRADSKGAAFTPRGVTCSDLAALTARTPATPNGFGPEVPRGLRAFSAPPAGIGSFWASARTGRLPR